MRKHTPRMGSAKIARACCPASMAPRKPAVMVSIRVNMDHLRRTASLPSVAAGFCECSQSSRLPPAYPGCELGSRWLAVPGYWPGVYAWQRHAGPPVDGLVDGRVPVSCG